MCMDINQIIVASDALGDGVSDGVIAQAAAEFSTEFCFECGDTVCDCGITFVGE